MKLSRRTLPSGAVGGVAAPREFTYKCGITLPDGHPMCIRGREAMQKIKEERSGSLDITLYTNSVLGQDTAMISQSIAGALEKYVGSLV